MRNPLFCPKSQALLSVISGTHYSPVNGYAVPVSAITKLLDAGYANIISFQGRKDEITMHEMTMVNGSKIKLFRTGRIYIAVPEAFSVNLMAYTVPISLLS